MATYFVDPDAVGDGSGTTWANACTTLTLALAKCTLDNDVVVVKSTVNHIVSADTTYQCPTGISVLIFAGTADDTSTAWTPDIMGADNYIGHSTSNYRISMYAADDNSMYLYGLTFRVAGGTNPDTLNVGGGYTLAEDCYFWQGNTNSGGTAHLTLGAQTEAAFTAIRCTLGLGHSGSLILCGPKVTLIDCVASGTAPTTIFGGATGSPGPSNVYAVGCDFSAWNSTNIAGNSLYSHTLVLERCKFEGGENILVAQTSVPSSGTTVLLSDCHSGDTHMEFGYADARGTLVKSTSAYVTAGVVGASWKIDTTSNATFYMPFITPWIDLYNETTGSAITPYIECLRNNGTATKYDDDEVWAEFTVKTNLGFTNAAFSTDRKSMDPDVSPTIQDTGAGTGSWYIQSSNLPASFKCDSGASVTPDEIGYIRGRICVGLPSITVYVDPQIRT